MTWAGFEIEDLMNLYDTYLLISKEIDSKQQMKTK